MELAEDDRLRFDHASLFGVYPQVVALEPVSQLYSALEPAPPLATDASPPCSGGAAAPLFRFLEDAFVARFTLDFAALERLFHYRCRPLLGELRGERPLIDAACQTFARRLILEALARDERGGKFRETLGRLEQLYVLREPTPGGAAPSRKAHHVKQQQMALRAVRGGKSNTAHATALWALVEETTRDSLGAEDAFYEKCARPKRRGRRPDSERETHVHAVNRIKAAYILSQRAPSQEEPELVVSAEIDYYPLFLHTLVIFNACIPRAENHGAFLEVLWRAVALLGGEQWPMRGLVKALLNAEAVLPLRKTVVPATPDTRYRCAYSGAQLAAGEEVWHVRILTRCGRRLRRWELGLEGGPSLPAARNIAPEYVASVRAFLVRPEVVSQCSLFYAEFPADYRRQYAPQLRELANARARVEALARRVPQLGHFVLPANRAFVVTPLWLLLNGVRELRLNEALADLLWLRRRRGRALVDEMARIEKALGEVRVQRAEEFTHDLIAFLFDATFGGCDAPLRPLQEPAPLQAYLETLADVMLDFVDTLFALQQRPAWATRDVVVRRAQSLPLLVERYAPEDVEAEQTRKRVVPTLREDAYPLLAQLLQASSERDLRRETPPSEQEERARLARLELCVSHHAALFITLFERLFEPATASPLLMGEAVRRLAALGIEVGVRV